MTPEAVEDGLDASAVIKAIGPIVGGGGGGRPVDGARRRQGREPPRRGARRRAQPALGVSQDAKALALDYGSARTGVAVSDPSGTLARPLCVVEKVGGKQRYGRVVCDHRARVARGRRRRSAAHAPWRAGAPGDRDRGVHRPTAQPMPDPDPYRGRAFDDVDSATDAYVIPPPELDDGRRRPGGGGAPADLPGPPRGVRRGRRRRVLIGALALLVVLAVVLFAADRVLFGGPSGPPGAPVQVRIPEGSSVEHIGDILDSAGVVGNGRRWALDVRLHGDGGGLRAGTYTLRRERALRDHPLHAEGRAAGRADGQAHDPRGQGGARHRAGGRAARRHLAEGLPRGGASREAARRATTRRATSASSWRASSSRPRTR